MYWLASSGGTPWAKLGGAFPEAVVIWGAVRLAAAAEMAALVPLLVSPTPPDWCRPLEDELLTIVGALGGAAWLEDDDVKVWRLLLLLSSLVIVREELVTRADPDE